jgi:hypothetical protein
LHAVPSLFCVGGVQLMVALPVVVVVPLAVTVIEKGVSCAVVRPSVTLIVMLEAVPTLEEVGVPLSVPVDVLKPAHAGLLEIWKYRVRGLVSVAVGVKL